MMLNLNTLGGDIKKLYELYRLYKNKIIRGEAMGFFKYNKGGDAIRNLDVSMSEIAKGVHSGTLVQRKPAISEHDQKPSVFDIPKNKRGGEMDFLRIKNEGGDAINLYSMGLNIKKLGGDAMGYCFFFLFFFYFFIFNFNYDMNNKIKEVNVWKKKKKL